MARLPLVNTVFQSRVFTLRREYMQAYQYFGPIDDLRARPHPISTVVEGGQEAIVKPLVVVVDDDESVRESLPDLLKEFGFAVITFSSAEDFLKSDSMGRADCLLLDVAMPGMTGPDLQDELKRRGDKTRVIFISALRDESIRKRVLQQGAVDILVKPFNDTALQRALSKAMGEAS